MNAADIIADRLITRGIYLERYKAGFNGKILAELEKLEDELTRELASAFAKGIPNPTQRIQRLEKLLGQTRHIIKRTYAENEDLAGRELLRLAANEQLYVLGAYSAATTLDVFQSLNYDELKHLTNNTLIEGAKSADWWARQSDDLQQRFGDQMRMGVMRGETLDQLVARVRGTQAAAYQDGVMKVSRRQAEALIRSSVQAVANSTRGSFYDANRDLISAEQWVATLDSRTTHICMALHGKMWTAGTHKPIGHAIQWPGRTAHWNCFTGDTPVQSPSGARRLYRRTYSGELVTIETANGRRVTATPNHPILTPSGWRAIGDIHIGDDLICKKGCGGSAMRTPENQRRETTFAELAKATSELPGVFAVKMPVSRPDFHGDGTDGEIGEVWSYSKLSREGNAALSQLLGDCFLQSGNLDGSNSLPRLGRTQQGFAAVALSTLRRVCSFNVRLLPARPSGVQFFGCGPSDTGSAAPAPKSGQSHTKLPSDFTGSEFIGEIECDRVSVVSRRKAVSILVHNLETPTGWYLADGIASHNCRSTQVAILKAWEDLVANQDEDEANEEYRRQLKRQGFSDEEVEKIVADSRYSLDGKAAKDITFDEWLATKSPEFQDQMLGRGRGKMFRDGKITLTDLIDQTSRPLTIDQLEALPFPRPKAAPVKLPIKRPKRHEKDQPGPLPSPARGEAPLVTHATATPRTAPVSGKLAIPADAARAPSYESTLRIIDAVHDDGDLVRVPLLENRATTNIGEYTWRGFTGQPISLTVSRAGPHPELTLVHEIGHMLDHQALDIRGEFASEGSALLEVWRRIVNRTPTAKKLKLAAAGKKVDGRWPTAHPDEFAQMLRLRELWARAYTQYVVMQAGNPALRAQFDLAARRMMGLYFWPDEEFESIELAIGSIFTAKQWLP